MWILVGSKTLNGHDVFTIDRAEWSQTTIDIQMTDMFGRLIVGRHHHRTGTCIQEYEVSKLKIIGDGCTYRDTTHARRSGTNVSRFDR
jgi:hypothetical protein